MTAVEVTEVEVTDVEVTEAAMVAAWAHEVMAEVMVVVTEAVVMWR